MSCEKQYWNTRSARCFETSPVFRPPTVRQHWGRGQQRGALRGLKYLEEKEHRDTPALDCSAEGKKQGEGDLHDEKHGRQQHRHGAEAFAELGGAFA